MPWVQISQLAILSPQIGLDIGWDLDWIWIGFNYTFQHSHIPEKQGKIDPTPCTNLGTNWSKQSKYVWLFCVLFIHCMQQSLSHKPEDEWASDQTPENRCLWCWPALQMTLASRCSIVLACSLVHQRASWRSIVCSWPLYTCLLWCSLQITVAVHFFSKYHISHTKLYYGSHKKAQS